MRGYDEPLPLSCSGVIDESEWRHHVVDFKRLEKGSFQDLDPSSRAAQASGSAGLELSVADLALILNGIDLATARRRKRYSRAG